MQVQYKKHIAMQSSIEISIIKRKLYNSHSQGSKVLLPLQPLQPLHPTSLVIARKLPPLFTFLSSNSSYLPSLSIL